MNDYEKKAKEQALKELEETPEMKKLREKEKKMMQEQQRIKDKIARLQKKETEKERKARTHRLIVLGAEVEMLFGCKIEEDSKEWEAIKHYLPQIRKLYEEGKFDERYAAILEEKKKLAEKVKNAMSTTVQVEEDSEDE